jgi:mono/diheme cytochrome c family protein
VIAMPISRRFRLLAAAPALSLAVFACSGGGEKAADTSATTPAATPATTATASAGETIYQQRCVTCHQANGAGIPGTFPPLAESEYANAADPGVPARIVIHGVSGPITVHGTTYNSLMPPYGVGVVMTDEEIAQLLTYVRSSFGNSASAVTAADVAKARQETASHTGPMTEALLKPMLGGK